MEFLPLSAWYCMRGRYAVPDNRYPEEQTFEAYNVLRWVGGAVHATLQTLQCHDSSHLGMTVLIRCEQAMVQGSLGLLTQRRMHEKSRLHCIDAPLPSPVVQHVKVHAIVSIGEVGSRLRDRG